MKPATPANRRAAALLLTWLFAWAVAACAAIPAADTFNKKLAGAYIGATAVAQMTGTAAATGKITPAQKDEVVAKLLIVMAALKAAESAHAANPTAAESHLTTALTVITGLQSYLASQGVR